MTTPIGDLLLVASDEGLAEIHFGRRHHDSIPDRAPLRDVIRQLEEYFAAERKTFDLPLTPRGTPFQLDVWNALRGIAYGHTRSYADIARAIGRPNAVRAVGAANGANPIPIVIPCHRVIGSSGSLTGFGGGLDMKRRLLDFEAGFIMGPWPGASIDRRTGSSPSTPAASTITSSSMPTSSRSPRSTPKKG